MTEVFSNVGSSQISAPSSAASPVMFGLEETVVGVVLGLLSPPTSPLADVSVKTSVSSVVVTSTPLSPSEPLRVLGGSDLW